MIREILKSFENLTPILWVSQVCGIIGFIVIVISYQFKKKNLILISTIAYLMFLLEQLFAGLFAAVIVDMFCVIRNVIMFLYLVRDNKELKFKSVLAINGIMWFCLIFYLALTNSFAMWECYIPPAVVTISTFTQNSKHESILKTGIVIHESGFLILYIIKMLPFSILRQVILSMSALISLFICLISSYKTKNATNSCQIEN